MKKLLVSLLLFAVSVTACSIQGTLPIRLPEKFIIEGNSESGLFEISYDGVRYPSGELTAAKFSLPGYKSVLIDIDEYRDSIMLVFELLQKAPKWDCSEAYSPLCGAGLHLTYCDESQTYSIDLFTNSDGKRIALNTDPMTDGPGRTIVSKELYSLIHEISGWKPFDIRQVTEIDAMSVQIMPMQNELKDKASDDAITIEGDELRKLMELLVQSAKVDDESSCPFNVSVIMLKNESIKYRGYLAGDSCPQLALETQYFKVDKEFLRQIYKKIDLDYMQ